MDDEKEKEKEKDTTSNNSDLGATSAWNDNDRKLEGGTMRYVT
jgi:hypothetical protein